MTEQLVEDQTIKRWSFFHHIFMQCCCSLILDFFQIPYIFALIFQWADLNEDEEKIEKLLGIKLEDEKLDEYVAWHQNLVKIFDTNFLFINNPPTHTS